MTTHSDAPDLQQEVQRLLGRCLIRLQQYEALIKYLVANHRLCGPAYALARIQAQRVEDYATKPLGYQIDVLLKSFLTTEGAPRVELFSEPHAFGYQSTLKMSAEDYAKTKAELKGIVESRNDIVHDFADRFDLNTPDGCAAARDHLNSCYARIDAQYQRLCAWANGVDAARAAIAAAFMPAPEGAGLHGKNAAPGKAAQWEAAGIVRALREAAAELKAGESGWARLDHAIARVREKHPAQTPAKYGCKSWKQVLNESSVFDLQYRPDGNDGRAAWFRERGVGI